MLQELKYLRTKNINGCMSYQANIPDVQAWLSRFSDLVGKSLSKIRVRPWSPDPIDSIGWLLLITGVALPDLIQRMLEPDPSLRPSAFYVAELTSPLCCSRCDTGREKLEAVRGSPEEIPL